MSRDEQGRRAAIRPAAVRDGDPRDDLTPFEAVNFQFDRAARRLGLAEDVQISLEAPFREERTLLAAFENVRRRAEDAGVPYRLAAFMLGVGRVARASELRGL